MQKSTLINLLNIDEDQYDTYNKVLKNLNIEFSSIYFPFIESKDLLPVSFYSYYPVVFQDFFNFSKKEVLHFIDLSHFHFICLFILDKLYDCNTNEEKLDFLIMTEMYSHAKSNIFKNIKNDGINVEIQKLYSMNMKSLYDEKYNLDIYKNIDMNDIELYCTEKYSFAKIIILLFSDVRKIDKNLLKLILHTHDKFAIARQILDDLTDYIEDFSENIFNIYLNQLDNTYLQSQKLNNTELKFHLINYSIKNFEIIKDILYIYNYTSWYKYIDFYHSEALNLKKDYEDKVKKD